MTRERLSVRAQAYAKLGAATPHYHMVRVTAADRPWLDGLRNLTQDRMRLMKLIYVWMAFGCIAACEDASVDRPKRAADAGMSSDAGPTYVAPQGKSGPWGACGPSPLAESVPDQVLEIAEGALQPGGWADRFPSDYTNPMTCKEVTLGIPYRQGTVDPSNLNGIDTPDSFLLFFDQYRLAWFCDGSVAGSVEVGFREREGKWQVVGVGGGANWGHIVGALAIDYAPDCQRAYVSTPPLGSWVIATDKSKRVTVQRVVFGSSVAHSKEEFVEQLSTGASH